MEVKKLDFGETLKDSVAIGVKNAPSVIAAVALWLITIWIPYLNVGTTGPLMKNSSGASTKVL